MDALLSSLSQLREESANIDHQKNPTGFLNLDARKNIEKLLLSNVLTTSSSSKTNFFTAKKGREGGEVAVSTLLKNSVELFSELEGNEMGQSWVLSLLCVCLPAGMSLPLSAEDFLCLVMLTNMLMTTESMFLLPVILDLASVVYTFAMVFCSSSSSTTTTNTATSSDDRQSLLLELESLRTGMTTLFSNKSLSKQIDVVAHGVQCLRDIILLFAEHHESSSENDAAIIVKGEGGEESFFSSSQKTSKNYVSVKFSASDQQMPPTKVAAIVKECIAMLMGYCDDSGSGDQDSAHPSIVIHILNALTILTLHRPSTWPLIFPQLSALVFKAFVQQQQPGQHQKESARGGGRGRGGHSPLTSPSVTAVLHQLLTLVLHMPKASSHHRKIHEALLASGGNLEDCYERQKRSAKLLNRYAQECTSLQQREQEKQKVTEVSSFIQVCSVEQAKFNMLTRKGTEGEEQEMGGENQNTEIQDSLAAVRAEEGLVSTSHGDLPLQDVVQMMLISLKAIPIESEKIEVQHFKGIQAMQFAAAKKAQSIEIEKLKLLESRGVEDIPVGQLLQHVDVGSTALHKGEALLEAAARRTMLMRVAFFSVFKSFRRLQIEEEGQRRHAEAIVARAFAQLPAQASDSAMDLLCDCLTEELKRQQDKDINSITSAATTQGPIYSIILEALFMKYALLCQRDHTHFFAFSIDDTQQQSAQDGGGGQRRLQNSTALLSISSDEPMEWISRLMHQSGSKRRRSGGAAFSLLEDEGFQFHTDRLNKPTAYTQFLSRVVHVMLSVITATNNAAASSASTSSPPVITMALEQLLLECPAITPPIWQLILKELCLSEGGKLSVSASESSGTVISKNNVQLGMTLLTKIIHQRKVYRMHALSLLFFCANGVKTLSRLHAVRELRNLMRDYGTTNVAAGAATLSSWENAVLEFAKKSIVKIATLRIAKFEKAILQEEQQLGLGGAEDEAQKRKREELASKKFDALVHRFASLFLVLCALPNYVSLLFSELLNVFELCERNDSFEAQHTLLHSADFEKFIRSLYQSPQSMLSVLKQMRNFPKGATQLVQQTLQIFSKELQFSIVGDATESKFHRQHLLIANTLINHCKALYEASSVSSSEATPHENKDLSKGPAVSDQKDPRFIIPVLSFLSRTALKKELIPAVLQMSVLPQREAASERAFQEMLTPCRLKFEDGEGERGMTPVDLLVFLHEVYQYQLPGVTGNMVVSGISAALRVKRKGPMDTDRIEWLYTPRLVEDCLRRLMLMRPIPTLTMRTAIVTTRVHQQTDDTLRRFVINTVVKELSKQHVWQSDDVLWKGAIMFFQEHWPETAESLLSLPQHVLLQTLRSNEKLRGLVMERLGSLPQHFSELLSEFVVVGSGSP